MSSQSSQSSQPTGTQALSMAPAALAQLIDRLSQDHGLDTAARQQLHLFAIQSSPSVDCLWVYAALLSHTGNFGQVMQQFGVVLQRLENLTNLVRHEWQLTEAQKSSIKELQRIILVRTQTNYRDVADRTKAYIGQNPLQFALPMYTTDNAAATVVNNMVERDAHQARGQYRKYIYAAAVGTRPLEVVARKIASAFSNEIGNGPLPTYYKAQIAQLRSGQRRIAFNIILAAGAPPLTNGKRTKADTGFWTKVDERFEALRAAHGGNYDTGNGWREWEADIIAQDEEMFDDQDPYFTPAVIQYHAPGVYQHAVLATQ
ncbi:hypothetical protein FRC08_000463 [Ceratobasidium sp. 394]|nr:hypothetical protein FRC08_000463 [Ceratobasidium sp. 394]